MAIYSSGSVFAQKLLMRHVKTGEKEGGKMESENLEGLVSGGWFDTVNAGLKAERGSYVKIAEALKVSLVSSHLFGILRFGRDVLDTDFGFSLSHLPSSSSATTLRRSRLRSLPA